MLVRTLPLLLLFVALPLSAEAQLPPLSVEGTQALGLEDAGGLEMAPSLRSEVPARRSRLAAATTLGGLAGVAGGFALAWAPALAAERRCTPEEDFCGLGAIFYMSAVTWGTPASTALGIWAAGNAAGGEGNYGVTLLGSALGGTLGAGIATLSVLGDSRAGVVAGFLTIPVLEWVGGVIAYHLSHNAAGRPRERRLLPSVRVEQRGASLQFGGAF